MSLLAKKTAKSIRITPLAPETLESWLKKQDARTRNWVKTSGYTASNGSLLMIPKGDGTLDQVLFGAGKDDSLYTYADLPTRLPPHKDGYYIDAKHDAARATQVALGWILGCYSFSRYKKSNKKDRAALIWPQNADKNYVNIATAAIYHTRDLINTPANDLGPDELEAAIRKTARQFGAKIAKTILGKDLVKKNFPAIYEVGKASPRAPRLVDFTWGNPKHPKVTLVGKGVVFDTGGLNIKTENYMLLMKKDMGGAGGVLAIAHMIMAAKLPVRLRVLVSIVENSVAGNSFRPGDVIHTRKGLTVEIGNTDAEGRLILSDALTLATSEKPALVIDMATLTGAARAAMGPDIPAIFCNNDSVADDLLAASKKVEDPLWRFPLWQPYKDQLASKIADTNNIGGGLGGHITAALFLEKFIEHNTPWVHIDTNAYNNASKPGRPEGGEALGVRACFEMIQTRFADKKKRK